MRKFEKSGSFLLTLLVSMLLNLEWSIPAWVLLALHFWIELPIIWFAVALVLWILVFVVWLLFAGWAARCGSTPEPPKESKNPYSVSTKRDNNIKKEGNEP